MARVVADDAGPSAFDVQLSISTGRSSPDDDPVTIKVNAGSTIRMVFMNGAYILRDKHGRDVDTLLKDFDLYLVRPGRDDIVLNPMREIADYGIKKNHPMDQLQFRHKTLPIPIKINLCEGDDRKIEVNSGFPLMDIIPTICQMFGIQEHSELSLARPSTSSDVQYEWLSLSSSLHGQDVHPEDKILLRKKFFILNDDITEATKGGNEDLRNLIYQQVRTEYLTGRFVGGCHGDDTECSLVSALLHQIEQGNESISDDEATCKVMPRDRQKDSSFYAQIVTTYYREHIGSLDASKAKDKLLHLLAEAQKVLVNYYPVKLSEDSPAHLIIIDSDSVSLCFPSNTGGYQISNKTWRIRDMRDTDISSQKEDLIKINVLGSWQSLYSQRRQSLSSYLLEAVHLSKIKGGKARLSARVTSPEVNEVFKRNSQLWQAELSPGSKEVIPVVTTTETRQEPTVSYSMFVGTSVDPPSASEATSPPSVIAPPPSATTPPASEDPLPIDETRLSFEWPVNEGAEVKESVGVEGAEVEESAGVEGAEIEESAGVEGVEVEESAGVEEAGVKESAGVEGAEVEESAGVEPQNGDITITLDTVSTRSESSGPAVHPMMDIPTDIELVKPPEASPPREERKRDLARTTVHIPDFLELNWTGLVQGAYPVEKKSAVRLGALLTQVYYGDRERAQVWPPSDYDAKTFLPEKFHNSFGIAGEIERAHRDLTGASTHECINDVIEACQKLTTHQGVFFDVSVPVKSEIMAVIPWKKMEHRWFGINQYGIFSVEQDTGKVLFTHRFSDIYKWTSTENSFQLNFKEWAEEFHGYTYQTREILNTLELFIQMTLRGKIDQAPSKPSSISSSTSPLNTPPPTPVKSPLNDSVPDPPKRSSVSTPTSYDL